MAYRVIPKTHLRDALRRELDQLMTDDLVITHRGRPIAVVVHIDRWNELQDKVERLEEAVELLERDLPAMPPVLGERGPIRRG